jgi:anti-sigma factor RsiW
MDRLTDHSEIQELLGAYALDAVDPDEATQVERHLAECPPCQAEVASYREVAGLMGYTGAAAPPDLWERIAAGLEEQPPPLRLDRLQTPSSVAGPVAISPAGRTVSTRVFTAVLAVAAVLLVGLGIQVIRLSTRTSHLPNTVASQLMVKSYEAAAGEFDARHVSLIRTDGTTSVPMVILPNGTAYVDARELPRLAADRTYQLWGKGATGSAPVSLAVMGSDPVIQQLSIPSDVTALAVTLERAGGVPAPTTPALAQGQIVG